MNNKSSKDILLSMIGVLILIVAVIGISYALWTQNFVGNKENSIRTGNVNFSYTENSTNGIYLDNALPMDDEAGKSLSGDRNEFDFTVSSSSAGITNFDYEIYAVENENNTLDRKYVKVYLTDINDTPVSGYNNKVPTFEELNSSSIGDNSKMLYSSELGPIESKKFRLRIWVSSEYKLVDSSKSFDFKVNVKGQA